MEYVLRGAHMVVHGGRLYLLGGGSSSRRKRSVSLSSIGGRSSRGLARCLAAEQQGTGEMSSGGGLWSGGEVEQVNSNHRQPKSTSGAKSELYTRHRCECAKPRNRFPAVTPSAKPPEAFPAFGQARQIEGLSLPRRL
jgi:hypothetical protein